MGAKALTEELYLALLKAFREFPGQHYKVATICGCDGRTALKAWGRGFPEKKWDPIEITLTREALMARSKVMAETAARRASAEKDREDAVKSGAISRAQEGQMVTLSRSGALQALTVAGNLATAARELAVVVRKKLSAEASVPDEVPDPTDPSKTIPNPKQITTAAGLSLLQKIVAIQAQVNNLAHESMNMERLYLGEPTQLVGVVHQQSEMTMEELEVRIEMATEALRRSKESGGIQRVPTHSADKPTIGRRVTVQ